MGNVNSSKEKKDKCSIKNSTNPRPGYYTNGHEVYYSGKQMVLLQGETPSSFQKLGYSYAKTNKRVFYKGQTIVGTDPVTFETLDRKQQTVLLSPDQKGIITRLNGVVGRDRCGIYFHGSLLKI